MVLRKEFEDLVMDGWFYGLRLEWIVGGLSILSVTMKINKGARIGKVTLLRRSTVQFQQRMLKRASAMVWLVGFFFFLGGDTKKWLSMRGPSQKNMERGGHVKEGITDIDFPFFIEKEKILREGFLGGGLIQKNYLFKGSHAIFRWCFPNNTSTPSLVRNERSQEPTVNTEVVAKDTVRTLRGGFLTCVRHIYLYMDQSS